MFALTRQAQQGTAKKWDPRSRVGIYLGPSPRHAGNISLILNPLTGLISPQFHVAHDDFFETLRNDRYIVRTKSMWQDLSGIGVEVQKEIRENFVTQKTRRRMDKHMVHNRAAEIAPRRSTGEPSDAIFGMHNDTDQTNTGSFHYQLEDYAGIDHSAQDRSLRLPDNQKYRESESTIEECKSQVDLILPPIHKILTISQLRTRSI